MLGGSAIVPFVSACHSCPVESKNKACPMDTDDQKGTKRYIICSKIQQRVASSNVVWGCVQQLFYIFERDLSMKQAGAQRHERIGVRLNQEEVEKVKKIADFAGCSFSEAVRRVIRATRVESATIMPHDNQPQEALA